MSLEDVRQMTASHEVQKAVNLPMAAGAESFSQWDAPRQEKQPVAPPSSGEAKVLQFPKREQPNNNSPPATMSAEDSEMDFFHNREMFKRREEHIHQKDGVGLYKRITEAHIFRSSKDQGSKLKFAHTNGVLINKKQS